MQSNEAPPVPAVEDEANQPPWPFAGAWHFTQLSRPGRFTSVATTEASGTGVLPSSSRAYDFAWQSRQETPRCAVWSKAAWVYQTSGTFVGSTLVGVPFARPSP